MTDRRGVAPQLYDLLRVVGGVTPPLRLVGWDDTTAGTTDGPTIRVTSRRAVRRILWTPSELGLARAYVTGELEVDGDLASAFRSLADYAAAVGPRTGLTPVHRREVLRTAVLVGAVGPAPKVPDEERAMLGDGAASGRQQTVAAAGVATFERVLGATMSSSCAWFESHDQSLDDAQVAKLDRVCQSLGLQPGMRLLDLGCGWGALLVHAVERYGVTAVGVVGSSYRARAISERLAARGLADRVEIRPDDADPTHGLYDAVAALEAGASVREPDLADFATRVRSLLRPGGRLVQQQVTRRGDRTDAGETFMTTYVQPRGTLFPLGSLLSAYDAAGLEIRTTTSLREHYPRTLLSWLGRMEDDWAGITQRIGEPRARMWRLVLAASAVGFERARISVHQVLAVRPHDDGRSGVPPAAA